MLEIKHISKIYKTADLTQKALNDVSLKFRENEFASILGASGSGKTTLLNIIGGLDKYTSGDLIINDISTKKYNSRDWDSYRNHCVGFIFQSYNLITHQNILRNVELALTLSGVSKSERVKRAKKALKEVGLEKHMYKRPNQLSGGQMQRVAIARALINNPNIILADEPTGALDTKTSEQIMELLKKIAKDKLVIMVTHNPELANIYSNRIIKLSDGKIVDDSNPFDGKEEKLEIEKKEKKPSMSFLTALGLSFNNLLTKKGRTILTAFAGSIGIIGIALILSLSNGFQNYIDKLQEDTLTSYPLTIESQSMDFASLMISMMQSSKVEGKKEGIVSETQQFASMFSNVTTNDLKSFKKYLEDNKEELSKDLKNVTYSYSIDPNIYTKYKNEIVQINPNSIFNSMFGNSSIISTYSSNSSIFVQYTDEQMKDLLDDYKVVKGRMPKNYDEIILVLPNENAISDLMLYMMGLRDMEELYDIMSKVMTGEKVEIKNVPLEFSYDELLNLEYKLVYKTDLYKYNKKYKIYEDMKDDKEYLKKVYDKALRLKVVGVLAPINSNNTSGMSGGLIYSEKLTKHIINEAAKTDLVKKQLENEDINVFSNKKFSEDNKKNNLNFEDFISIDTNMLQNAFNMNISEDDIKNLTVGYSDIISSYITTDNKEIKETLINTLVDLTSGLLKYSKNLENVTVNDADNITNDYLETKEANDILSKLESVSLVPASTFKSMICGDLSLSLTAYLNVIQMPFVDKDEAESQIVNEFRNNLTSNEEMIKQMDIMSNKILEGKMQVQILTKVGELSAELMGKISSSFNVDSKKIAAAFKFNMSENELARLMSAMSNETDANASTNLINLGYQDLDKPTAINVTFYSFDSKQNFLDVIEKYNKDVKKKGEEDKEINYTDTTGVLMSSVKKIVDSVSYVLISFVSIALIVSSIMIGIITYISVLERTKEIGILRSIGASKRNISSIFNAETFIIGLLSGIIGIGFTLAVIPPINSIIHKATGNFDINASIPIKASIILIILSVVLTLIGGLIPSRIASKKDPVEALRTE